jgi:hypothetical protein
MWTQMFGIAHELRALGQRRPQPRPLESSLSQGAEWKALISKYIGTMPPNSEAPCVAEQSISGMPLPTILVSSAITAKVGAAARHSQSAAPRAALSPDPDPLEAAAMWGCPLEAFIVFRLRS